jgi:Uncharacterized conserved protein
MKSNRRSSGVIEIHSLLYLIHVLFTLMVCISGGSGTHLARVHADPLAVCIYSGPGAADVKDYQKALAEVMPDDTSFQFLDPDAVVSGKFAENCDLFVMPGGADKPYCEALNGPGNKNIRAFIEAGGCYYGTCAGAYYGAATLLFDEQNPTQRMNETRELKFFSGQARGPLFIPYPEGGPYPAQIALGDDAGHVLSDTNFTAYYYGGPFFDYPNLKDGTYKVLAYYSISEALEKTLYLRPERAAYWNQNPPALAAILSINIGKGHVILTGVHLENTTYDAKNKGKRWNRQKMLMRCLQEMGLPTKL